MKEIEFLGNSLNNIRAFPDEAKQDIGFQLDRVQRGHEPSNWKPMKSIGLGVKEIRTISSEGIYRTVYVAKFKDAIFVLHAFKKKTQKTSKKDLDLAKKYFKLLNGEKS